MNCPKCSRKAAVTKTRKLTSGKRRNRCCSSCGHVFVTIDQGQGERLIQRGKPYPRQPTVTFAELPPEYQVQLREMLEDVRITVTVAKREALMRGTA
jgi:methionyl-tRNA synthetase